MAVELETDLEELSNQLLHTDAAYPSLPNAATAASSAWSVLNLIRRRKGVICSVVLLSMVMGIVFVEIVAGSTVFYGATFPQSLLQFLVVGLGGGLAIGVGLAATIDMRDQSFHCVDQIHEALDVPLLAHIPRIEQPLKRSVLTAGKSRLSPALVCHHHPDDVISQRIASLRSRLISLSQHQSGMLVQITSAKPSEGRTTTLSNLAVSLARLGKRVLVVDADFDDALLHAHFGLDGEAGVMEVLDSRVNLPDAIGECPEVPGLEILRAGNRREIDEHHDYTPQLAMMLKELRDDYDFVLIDSPPVLDSPDSISCTSICDATLLVVNPACASQSIASTALQQLRLNDANVVGVVINNVDSKYFDDQPRAQRRHRSKARVISSAKIVDPTDLSLAGSRTSSHAMTDQHNGKVETE
ncbi:MAG: AAA family ATPase [Pirellulaceae bacterium]|nr:AAA family ATPase [Pirellulaceae bacterium]